jgi:hypothetical protein
MTGLGGTVTATTQPDLRTLPAAGKPTGQAAIPLAASQERGVSPL